MKEAILWHDLLITDNIKLVPKYLVRRGGVNNQNRREACKLALAGRANADALADAKRELDTGDFATAAKRYMPFRISRMTETNFNYFLTFVVAVRFQTAHPQALFPFQGLHPQGRCPHRW